MKRLLLAFAMLLCALPALAQVPYLNASQIAPHWGFVRKSPCAAGNADLCGSNPPTWHLTPEWCGTVISTSAFRNADSTASTKGVRVTLPTAAEFAAAGYTASGAEGNTGTANREGQCEISFVMGLPLPGNWLQMGLDGVQGGDKVTFLAEGVGHDIFSGDVVVPAVAGTITVAWNGVSWLGKSMSPTYAEKLGAGQMSSQGQGRLFVVGTDPSWNTVGTLVGKLAYCPHNGMGSVTDSNGTTQLIQIPINCAFMDPPVGTSNAWIGLRSIVSMSVPDGGQIAQGASYSSGTAPDGTAYAAGAYVVVPITSSISLVSGTTVSIHNLPTTLGGRNYLQGKWIIKLLTSGDTGCTTGPCIELHERVNDTNAQALTAVSAPSAFITSDTIDHTIVDNDATTAHVIGGYLGLANTSGATARYTDSAHGTEREATNKIRAIVGFARYSSNAFSDTTTSRLVASHFNPVEKKCQVTMPSDKTVTNTSFVEVDSTNLRCNFVYISGASAQAMSLGDTGRRVRYTATVGAGNGTAGDGCEFAVGFDGTTAEPETPGFVNPAGVSGGRQTVTVSGNKAGLTETNHYVTLLARAVTGGTCTIYSGSTNLSAWIWQ